MENPDNKEEKYTPSLPWETIYENLVPRADSEEVFNIMMDSPTTRKHLILPGLWLGNMCAAGGLVPLFERTPEALAEIREELKSDNISCILSLAENLCCYPDDTELEYL